LRFMLQGCLFLALSFPGCFVKLCIFMTLGLSIIIRSNSKILKFIC
jgi:hypothetical protein